MRDLEFDTDERQSPKTPDLFANAPELDELRRKFREAIDGTQECRDQALRDNEYFHGEKQLSSAMRAELARRRQPATYWNRIRPAVQGVLGLLDSNQTDPQAIGRNDEDEAPAQVVTQVLRYLADNTDFEEIKRACSRDLLIFGTMASITEVDEQGDAAVSPIPYREFFWDPLSLRPDFSDARYMGRAKWMDADAARRAFPEAEARLGNFATSSFQGDGPESQLEQRKFWLGESRKLVRVVELYYIDGATGAWHQAIYTHAGLLHWSVSPYQDEYGAPACPITALSYEVDEEGDRYGYVRDMRSLQDVINNNLSKQTHILNSAQVEMYDAEANPVDAETARREALNPNGVIPRGYRRIAQNDLFQGATLILDKTLAALDRMAPSPALLGRAGGANESGRARQILQQAGFTELARAFSYYEAWERRTYEQMWFRALQFMDDERMILVTDDAGARQKLTLNRVQYQAVEQVVADPATGLPVRQLVNTPVAIENQLASMDMDITLKVVRQADTLRGEAVEKMLEWSAKTGVSVLDPSFELVIEMSDIPNKPYVLDKYRALASKQDERQAAAQQQQALAAQQAQDNATMGTQSKVMRDQAQADRDAAQATKLGVEAESAALELAVNRAMVGALGATPGQL